MIRYPWWRAILRFFGWRTFVLQGTESNGWAAARQNSDEAEELNFGANWVEET